MIYTHKPIGTVYEVSSRCSKCNKKGITKTITLGLTEYMVNPFRNNNEAMPVGWYSSGSDIYCGECNDAN